MADVSNPGVTGTKVAYNGQRVVTATIIDKNDFIRASQPFHHLSDPPIQLREGFLLVADRNNKGKTGRGGKFLSLSS